VKFEGKEQADNIETNAPMGKKGVRRKQEDSEAVVWPRSAGSSRSSFSLSEDDDDDEFEFDEEIAQESSSSTQSISSDGSPVQHVVVEKQQVPSTNTGRLSPKPPTCAAEKEQPPKPPTRFNQAAPKPPPSSKSFQPPKRPARSESAAQQPPKPPATRSPQQQQQQQQQQHYSRKQPPPRSKSAHPPAGASTTTLSSTWPKQQVDPTRTTPLRTSSYTSAGVVFNRSPLRARMQTTNNRRPGGGKKKSMDDFEHHLRRRATLPQDDTTTKDEEVRQPRAAAAAAAPDTNNTNTNSTTKDTAEKDEEDEHDEYSVDEESCPHSPPLRRISAPSPTVSDFNNILSSEDIEICQRLDEEYERALEEREIGYNARYSSVRQSAFLSVFFMVAYLCLGTAFFARQTAWSLPDALLFSIYTITTVGYGRGDLPTTPGFQSYTIFYILVGIAALTIMVSFVLLLLFLEAIPTLDLPNQLLTLCPILFLP
jgi:hypothetical protein